MKIQGVSPAGMEKVRQQMRGLYASALDTTLTVDDESLTFETKEGKIVYSFTEEEFVLENVTEALAKKVVERFAYEAILLELKNERIFAGLQKNPVSPNPEVLPLSEVQKNDPTIVEVSAYIEEGKVYFVQQEKSLFDTTLVFCMDEGRICSMTYAYEDGETRNVNIFSGRCINVCAVIEKCLLYEWKI